MRTFTVYLTVHIYARLSIINAIAITNVETALRTVAPDRVLDEPRKGFGKRRIELARIDAVGHGLNNVRTTACLVAGCAVGMVSPQTAQDAGSMQKIVNQGVDRDHARADLNPVLQFGRRTEQDARQCHSQHLVRDAVDSPERLNQSIAHLRDPVGIVGFVGRPELIIDPADKIVFGDVANEQEQAIGSLVKPAIAQIMAW
jgi:hypothetical protein